MRILLFFLLIFTSCQDNTWCWECQQERKVTMSWCINGSCRLNEPVITDSVFTRCGLTDDEMDIFLSTSNDSVTIFQNGVYITIIVQTKCEHQ